MKTVAYIHGLNSSHRSFGYLLGNLPEHNVVKINYNSHKPLAESVLEVLRQLPKTGEFSLVGHSLGGLIAALIAGDHQNVSELITISSPLAGSKAANIGKWLPGAPAIMRDLVPSSNLIMRLKDMKFSVPTLSIVSTAGHLKALNEPNDSIVAIESQKALNHGKKVEVKANHFEVLMHERTTELVRKHLFGDQE